MLIVDFSNLVFMEVHQFFRATGIQPKNENDIRNLLINALIEIKKKFSKYGDMVIAVDGKHYWRKDIFPYYKAKRKTVRDKSEIDWDAFFPVLERIKEEIAENFPAKMVCVENAEADDIVAILASRFGSNENVCIWSSDSDILQVQNFAPKVKQYSPFKRRFITPKSEEYNLFEHIVRGDSGDGVPNILSEEDIFVQEVRKKQKAITKTMLEKWSLSGINDYKAFCTDENMQKRFEQNRRLIDFFMIPKEVADAIVEKFNEVKEPKGKIFGYLVKYRMTKLLANGV